MNATFESHDVQTGVEDAETVVATVARYGLGARGVDIIERVSLPSREG